MAKHSEINEVIRKFKSNKISHDECFKYLANAFQPLFFDKQKEMAKVNTDHTWIGDFWDVYLNALECSLKSFNFNFHTGPGPNLISFVPYFKSLFYKRADSYKTVIYKVIEEKSNNFSLESMLDKMTFSKTTNVDIFDYIQHSDDAVKNEVEFEAFLKNEVLSPTEYKIFFMKMKGKSNAYIGSKMKRPLSKESIRKKWNDIAQKIHVRVNKRKNDV